MEGVRETIYPSSNQNLSQLTSMGSKTDEPMKITILVQFLSNWEDGTPMISSRNTMEDSLATWNHVTIPLLVESEVLTNCKVNNVHNREQLDTATLTA